VTAVRLLSRLCPGAVALTALAAFAPPALGAVRMGPDRVVVTAKGGGKAVVERRPFGIKFEDRRGRTLLREVRKKMAGTQELPTTLDPEPFGLEREPDNATYAPLSFEVGREGVAQWNAGTWTGDLLFSRREGTVHWARRVRSVRRAGSGVRLAVAATGSARRLVVRIERDRGAALRVRARPSSDRGVITMGDSFKAPGGEDFYGFGGRHGEVAKRGHKLTGWVDQESLGGEPTLRGGLQLLPSLVEDGSDYTIDELGGAPAVPGDLPGGFERYLAPGGPDAAYYPQAQFVSSRGYGFLLNQSPLSRWRMGNDGHAWQVQASGSKLDYTVTLGGGRRSATRTLTNITGRHRVPPAWSQGAILSRAVSVPPLPGLPPTETAASYRAKVERDLADMERFGVRPSAYAFEGWALLDDLDYVRDVIRRLHRRGIRAVLYVRAYVSDDALRTQPPGDFEETMRRGLVATDASGRPYVFGANGGGPATLLDFTNPKTVDWWRGRLHLLLDLGADGFMQDFGEQVQRDMHFADGRTGRAMHNRYPVIYHRVSRRILDGWARRHRNEGPVWFFNRAGYSGRPGSAAFEMGNFPGDETVDWSAGSGLRSLAPDMLNRAVGGAFGYTTDIGGYADFLTGPPSEELFTRWTEWAALTPYFRVHNSAVAGTRMPWSYGAEALARWKALAALHDSAIPYMRRLWRRGRRTGMPITRPLWLAARRAPGAEIESQEWLLGPKVLVAPVVEEGATKRAVSFPRGCWKQQGGEGARIEGPARTTVAAPLGQLPYFVRCGKHPFARR
jgi:sulfoquinovosidase